MNLLGKRDILMPVMNGVLGDSRVIKTANTLVDAGYSVLVVGYTARDQKVNGYVSLNQFKFDCFLINGFSTAHPLVNGISKEDARKVQLYYYVQELLHLATITGSRLIYTHDMSTIFAGKFLKMYLKLPWIHDLHEWVNGLTNIDTVTQDFSISEEVQSIKYPDKLFTVSDSISKIYQSDYDLVTPPEVLYNTPYAFKKTQIKTIRDQLGLQKNIPLAVYVGNVKPARGVDKFIHALGNFDDLHIALVTNNRGAYINEINLIAKKYKAAKDPNKRIHYLPYVPIEDLPHYISTATFGFHTMPRYGNGDVALPNKLFEYIQAGIPVAVSDATDMKNFVSENNCGAIFDDSNESIANAIKTILDNYSDLEPSEELKQKYNWENEGLKIVNAVEEFIAPLSSINTHQKKSVSTTFKNNENINIFQGLAHSAGQPHALSSILNEKGKEFQSRVYSISRHKFGSKQDFFISDFKSIQKKDIYYFLETLREEFSIFHFHSRSFFWDPPLWKNGFSDLSFLKSLDAKVIFNFRGSELRNPELFKEINRFAYTDTDPLNISSIYNDKSQSIMKEKIAEFSDLILVPDQELQYYFKDADILPRATLSTPNDSSQFFRDKDTLRILHAPSASSVKGSDYIYEAVKKLEKENYKFTFITLQNAPHFQVLEEIKKADLVIDQILIGWYGVFTVEALSQGKPVVSYLNESLPIDGLPIINANPETIFEVLRNILDKKVDLKEISKKSYDYFINFHSKEAVYNTLTNYYKKILDHDEKSACNDFAIYSQPYLDQAGYISSNKELARAARIGLDKKIIKEQELNELALSDEISSSLSKQNWESLNTNSIFSDDLSPSLSNKNTLIASLKILLRIKTLSKSIKKFKDYIIKMGILRGVKYFFISKLEFFAETFFLNRLFDDVRLSYFSIAYDHNCMEKNNQGIINFILKRFFYIETNAVSTNLEKIFGINFQKIYQKKSIRSNYYSLITLSLDEEINIERIQYLVRSLTIGGYLIVKTNYLNYERQNIKDTAMNQLKFFSDLEFRLSFIKSAKASFISDKEFLLFKKL